MKQPAVFGTVPFTASVFGTVPKIARSCTDYSKNCELSITRTVVNIVGVAAQSFPRDRRQAQQTTTKAKPRCVVPLHHSLEAVGLS